MFDIEKPTARKTLAVATLARHSSLVTVVDLISLDYGSFNLCWHTPFDRWESAAPRALESSDAYRSTRSMIWGIVITHSCCRHLQWEGEQAEASVLAFVATNLCPNPQVCRFGALPKIASFGA